MSLAQFLLILRARWKALLATFLVVVAGTVGISLVLPKQYTATTTLVVDFKGVDPILGMMLPAQMMPGYMATQVDIIQSHKVAADVVKVLRLTDNPVAREQWQEETEGQGTPEDWYADALLKKLDVRPSRESNVVEISWTGSDPKFAAIVAGAFTDAYIKTNLEMRVDPARQTAAFFDEQLKILRENLERAQSRVSEYQRQRGYSSPDERLDIENARLAELSGQYSIAQAQAADALTRHRQLKDFIARGANPDSLPDVLANPLVQSLKSQLAASEARLEQTSSQLGANHPEVQRLKADIGQQRAKLESEVTTAGTSLSNAARLAERREFELRQAVAEQKAKLMRSNQGRDEMAVLMKEVESAQRAYDTASMRFTQTNLESQTSQTNISVLTRAIPPIEPSSPRVLLNTLLSIVLGSMLGVGVVLIAELLDRRVRSAGELAEAVQAPVLGVLLKDKSARRRTIRWGQKRLPAPARSMSVAPKAS